MRRDCEDFAGCVELPHLGTDVRWDPPKVRGEPSASRCVAHHHELMMDTVGADCGLVEELPLHE